MIRAITPVAALLFGTAILLTGQGLTLEAAGDGWLAQIYRQTVKGQWL